MTPSGELHGKGMCGVFADKTVWSTPERLRGEVLTTRRYTNLRYLFNWYTTHCNVNTWRFMESVQTCRRIFILIIDVNIACLFSS